MLPRPTRSGCRCAAAALSVLEPAGGKALEDPEDLRALARVLDAQRSGDQRKRAIDVLQLLVTKNLATAEDRFFMARVAEISGDWPRALAVYRDLNLRTKNPRDPESLNAPFHVSSPVCRGLLRNHKAGNEQELLDAQDLVDELTQRQPDAN